MSPNSPAEMHIKKKSSLDNNEPTAPEMKQDGTYVKKFEMPDDMVTGAKGAHPIVQKANQVAAGALDAITLGKTNVLGKVNKIIDNNNKSGVSDKKVIDPKLIEKAKNSLNNNK
jgi:hypothetical protein